MSRHLPVVGGMRTSVHGDGTRETVHPADVRGRFLTARRVVYGLLVVVYLAVPWLSVGGRPAVLLDIAQRRFLLFGAVLNAQDAWLLFFVLFGVGLTLIAVTTVLGRVWCGWACPQTVFLEGVFRPLQRLLEGSRNERLQRERKGWTLDRVWRRTVLWSIYLLLASAIAHVFLGYFVPIRSFLTMISEGPVTHPQAFFWVTFFTGVWFFDFAWFREQTCLAICPYGRLQSVMTDDDSLVVGYDKARGEPRGKVGSEGAGDCVDCGRCVVVCPTGIDIRNGLQLDCIGCTACIDACDEVMDRLHRPRGLVRYDSLNGLVGNARRWMRPRLFFYLGIAVLWAFGVFFATRTRTSFEANLLRLQGAPYSLEGTTVRNAFNIHLVNKLGETHTFVAEPLAPPAGVTYLIPMTRVRLAPFEGAHLPVFVTVPRGQTLPGGAVRLRVRCEGTADVITAAAPFLQP